MSRDWRPVIWGAWRDSEDEDFAGRLLDLVADEPMGWAGTLGALLWGLLYGGLAGLLWALWPLREGGRDLGLVWEAYENVPWAQFVPGLLWGLGIGAGLALLTRFLLGRRLTWRLWLLRCGPGFWPIHLFPHLRTLLLITLGGLALGGTMVGLGLWLLLVLLVGRLRIRSQGERRVVDWGLLGRWGRDLGLQLRSLRRRGGPLFSVSCAPTALLMVLLYVGLTLASVVFVRLNLQAGSADWSFLWPLAGMGLGLLLLLLGGPLAVLLLVVLAGWFVDALAGGLSGFSLACMAGAALLALLYGLSGLLQGRSIGRGQPRFFWFWWRRPYAWELEAALRRAVEDRPGSSAWPEALRLLDERRAAQGPPAAYLTLLQSEDWEERFAARQALVGLGGEALEDLLAFLDGCPEELRGTVRRLIQDIVEDSHHRLAPRLDELLCADCLVRCVALQLRWPGPDLFYYGCRSCGQNRRFRVWAGEMVAVLDERMEQAFARRGDALWVNWLRRRRLFDFDRVEIGRVSDEAVEHFALQVANDPDEERRRCYRRLRCVVRGEIGENSRRILQNLFGDLE
ncbi:MAG: hypothetical protein JXA37_03955 [Chloroflexia bacterium]|nr:hypothetical protein [Chloroflexia bacterium]